MLTFIPEWLWKFSSFFLDSLMGNLLNKKVFAQYVFEVYFHIVSFKRIYFYRKTHK